MNLFHTIQIVKSIPQSQWYKFSDEHFCLYQKRKRWLKPFNFKTQFRLNHAAAFGISSTQVKLIWLFNVFLICLFRENQPSVEQIIALEIPVGTMYFKEKKPYH
ncbi:hypothetical protein KIL84_003619 [Mauremys mutica]|uniref:Uncharacterized protein n=1 Tax=Mauremys mutica TaxID=74926 RepID=A0A9D4ATN7_9SAUR|nr:hypothetical protein KIL84_003619 [Mauremys mutica]